MCSQLNTDGRFASYSGPLTEDEVSSRFAETFGRMPDIILSPPSSGTDKWWLGYLSDQEYEEFSKLQLQDAIFQQTQRLAARNR